MQYRDDLDVLENLRAIKRKNKVRLAAYIAEHNGVNVDPDSIFDVQVKRLHEYKRQLLNVLYILTLYNEIKDHPEKPVYPADVHLCGQGFRGLLSGQADHFADCRRLESCELRPAGAGQAQGRLH